MVNINGNVVININCGQQVSNDNNKRPMMLINVLNKRSIVNEVIQGTVKGGYTKVSGTEEKGNYIDMII